MMTEQSTHTTPATEAKEQHQLVAALRNFQARVHNNAKAKGFWSDAEPNAAEKIALMHQELSELLESLRGDKTKDKHVPLHLEAEVECADVIIRVLDFAEWMGYDVAQAMVDKAAFNETRPHKHGKNF